MTQPGNRPVITWYDVLGVLPGASAEQVMSQHDAKVSLVRPELVAGAPSPVVLAATRAREILDAARRVLADPASRARYDEAVGIRRRGGGLARPGSFPSEPGLEPGAGLVVAQSPGPAARARRGSPLTVRVWHPPARSAGSGRVAR